MRLIESCLPHSENGAIDSEDASQIIIKEFWKQLTGDTEVKGLGVNQIHSGTVGSVFGRWKK